MTKFAITLNPYNAIGWHEILEEYNDSYKVTRGPAVTHVYKEDVVIVLDDKEESIARAIEAKSAVYMLDKHIANLQEEIQKLENNKRTMAWMILRGYASFEDSKLLVEGN